MFWEMSLESFEDFFAHLKTVETRSLHLTREVPDEREHFETIVQGLLQQIITVMSTKDELQQEQKVLERLQSKVSNLEKQQSTYTVRVVNQRKVDLDPGVYVMNCLICNFTCHYPCSIANG